MAQYGGINALLDHRAMKCNRFAVFAASAVHCRGESRVKGNPQVSDVGDLGNSVVGVCRGEIRRKGREVPNNEV